MEINNGWIKWENVGETLDVELKGIQYNKNGNPYAVANKLTPLKEGESPFIKFNISKTDAGLKQGRYTVTVTSINNGFGFVKFKPLQDSSWDIHDNIEHATVNEVDINVNPIVHMQRKEKESVLESIQATHNYINSLSYNNENITYCINEILRELYLQLGTAVAKELEDK